VGDLSIFILFLLAVAILLGVDFIFYVVYVIVGVYAVSLWYVPRAAAKLRVSRRLTDHAFLGETVTVIVGVENCSRLPVPWLHLSESVPVRLKISEAPRFAFSLAGRQSKIFTYTIRAFRRGYYRIGPLQISSGDFFGFNESVSYAGAAYLTVYPRITPLSKLALRSRLPYGTIVSRQRLFEDPARPAGVRTYHAGDSLRQINWKVSAHASSMTDALMVKTVEPAISLESSVLLNLFRDDYSRRTMHDAAEWAIEVAASLAAHLVEQRQAVGLFANGNDPLRIQGQPLLEAMPFDKETGRLRSDPQDVVADNDYSPTVILPKAGRPHLMRILEVLARLELDDRTPFTSWALPAASRLGWGVTILVISPNADEAFCAALHQLVRSGFNPILIAVEPHIDFIAIRRRTHLLGFEAYHITDPSGFRFLTGLSSHVRAHPHGPKR
jgi:uncharacterized protein (DUF58 family)